MKVNNYTLNQDLLKRLSAQSGWIINHIGGESNQKVFLNTVVHISKKCESYENIVLSKLFLETGLKKCSMEKDGWRTFDKQMKTLAYKAALDIVHSIYSKEAM
jgi:7,8-dihydro-6-hydroxymethylpterin-pyrophosphokinase